MAETADVTFVAANNHPRAQAAANAIELKSLLSGEKARAPETLVKTYPELEEFAVSESTPDSAISPTENSTPQPKNTRSATTRGKKRKVSEDQQDLPM